MPARFARIMLVAAALTLALGPARTLAITIRDDVADGSYTNLSTDAGFQAVGRLDITRTGGGFICSGTLVAPRWVLTAAHCCDGSPINANGNVTAMSFIDSTGTTYTAASWMPHENWTGDLAAGWDIGLIELTTSDTDVTPATLFDGEAEVAKTATMVGYGRTGTGLTGDTLAAGTRRAGQNVIDGFGGGVVGSLDLSSWSARLYFSDFDQPGDPSESTMGSSSPLALEGSIAPGDSGGGTFIDSGGATYLAGVHSLGASIDGNTDFDYGDIFASTRVSQFIDWVTTNANGAASGGGAPEPATTVMFVAAIIAIDLATRRRHHRL